MDICSIKHISNIIGGGTPKTNIPAFWNGDIPWLTPADLSEYKENIYFLWETKH